MLVELLERDAVPWPTLEARYGSVLELIRGLLGVVPNADPYLEIWPPAYRARNVIVPNLLNMPLMLWGLGAPRSTVGLAMYASSRAAGCAYCSAHSCSFALRRGATTGEVERALDGGGGSGTDDGAVRAAVQVARGLSTVPASIGDGERDAFRAAFSGGDAEWIVLAVAMMGFLNQVNDALSVPLEEPLAASVNPVLASTGWRPGKHLRGGIGDGSPPGADSLWHRLSVVRFAPDALRLDRRWTNGVPGRWPDAGRYLQERVGHSFPVLAHLRHRRAVRAIATAVRETLGGETVIGRDEKLGAGVIYADTVGNERLGQALRAMGGRELADTPVRALAKAISPSPSRVDGEVVEAVRDLPPAGIVELVATLAVLQTLHRLSSFYGDA